jgi:hypothetical protein
LAVSTATVSDEPVCEAGSSKTIRRDALAGTVRNAGVGVNPEVPVGGPGHPWHVKPLFLEAPY